MPFKKCPGDANAYDTIWIDGEPHEVVEPESVEINTQPKKYKDKGGGYFSVDRSESGMLKAKIRKQKNRPRSDYEQITCSMIQYQSREAVFTLQDAFAEIEGQSPGDGETIELTFRAGNDGKIVETKLAA
ncbi:MAG: hypothetical protein AB7F96_16450 [Beijerinckiaceae bacterium]